MLKSVSRLLMGVFYIAAGANHFRQPRLYLRIIPPSLPYKRAINSISGAAEVVLGVLLLIPATARQAAWGVIALLLAVFPANIYHYRAQGAGMRVPQWLLLLRLPLQFVLIAWAYWHTRD